MGKNTLNKEVILTAPSEVIRSVVNTLSKNEYGHQVLTYKLQQNPEAVDTFTFSLFSAEDKTTEYLTEFLNRLAQEFQAQVTDITERIELQRQEQLRHVARISDSNELIELLYGLTLQPQTQWVVKNVECKLSDVVSEARNLPTDQSLPTYLEQLRPLLQHPEFAQYLRREAVEKQARLLDKGDVIAPNPKAGLYLTTEFVQSCFNNPEQTYLLLSEYSDAATASLFLKLSALWVVANW